MTSLGGDSFKDFTILLKWIRAVCAIMVGREQLGEHLCEIILNLDQLF